MKRDVRPLIVACALGSPDLTPAEKVLLVATATLATEYVDGKPRHGSRGMTSTGRFSLHRDYLAESVKVSPEAVRKTLRSLVAKRHLDRVSEGTFGRPSTYHALVVRGAKNGWVTGGQIGTPYGLAAWVTRGAESAPLTYRTPSVGDPAPTSGGSRIANLTVAGDDERRARGPVGGRLMACEAHGWSNCPDVRCQPAESREATG